MVFLFQPNFQGFLISDKLQSFPVSASKLHSQVKTVRFREAHILNPVNQRERGVRKMRGEEGKRESEREGSLRYCSTRTHTCTHTHTHTDSAYKGKHFSLNDLLSPSHNKLHYGLPGNSSTCVKADSFLVTPCNWEQHTRTHTPPHTHVYTTGSKSLNK